MSQRNIIQKTIIDLQYNGRQEGLSLQKEVTDWCNRKLVPGIETVLEEVDSGNGVTRINKLELEINTNAQGEWLQALAEKIYGLLREKLLHLRAQKDYGEIEELPGKHVFFETFIFFLRNGYLPWWSDITTKEDFLVETRSLVSGEIDDSMEVTLLDTLKDKSAAERLMLQVPDQEFFVLMQNFIPVGKVSLIKGVRQISLSLPPEPGKTIISLLKKAILAHVEIRDTEEFVPALVHTFMRSVADAGLIQLLQSEKSYSISADLKHEIERDAKTITPKDPTLKGMEEKPQQDRWTQGQRDTGEGIYIANAGLIIVAAFLPALFKKLNILDKNRIADDKLAVCITGYMTAGKEDIAEFELALPKILCGLELDTPVDTSVIFTREQKAEANDVLLSIIEYWNILGNTSVAGLQESFLQRNGKLSFNKGEILLKVEQRPYDMLLQHLPWNISLIKLPWMKYLLKTEWVY